MHKDRDEVRGENATNCEDDHKRMHINTLTVQNPLKTNQSGPSSIIPYERYMKQFSVISDDWDGTMMYITTDFRYKQIRYKWIPM